MALRIRPFEDENRAAVAAFNDRMAEGGSRWAFYDTPVPDWVPPSPSARAWRQYFLAVDDRDGTVRGGFVLKQQAFLLKGRPLLIGNVQGPVSEGIVNRRFAPLGAVMLKDSLARQPLQFGWGTSEQKSAILAQSGWSLHRFPLLLQVIDKTNFLRRSRVLSDQPRTANILRALAPTGLPQLALATAQAARALRPPSLDRISVTEADGFGPWADEVWRKAHAAYELIALRDAAALSCVMPANAWPNALPLWVRRNDTTIGWAAVRDRTLQDDALFSDLRVGSIIDALAVPGEEAIVAAAATSHLKRRGVQLIGAGFSNPRWIAAFRDCGFLALRNRRRFAASPALIEAAGGFESLVCDAHLTLVDGDGPRVF